MNVSLHNLNMANIKLSVLLPHPHTLSSLSPSCYRYLDTARNYYRNWTRVEAVLQAVISTEHTSLADSSEPITPFLLLYTTVFQLLSITSVPTSLYLSMDK